MNFEKSPEEEKSPLEQFQDEIETLKQKEISENTTVHLRGTEKYPGVDTSELTEEDREIWEKLQHEELTHREFLEEYKPSVIERGNQSRIDFMAFVANELSWRMMRDDLRSNEDK